jgi:hypothetical protein
MIRKGGAQGRDRDVDEYVPDENRSDQSSGSLNQLLKAAGDEGLLLFAASIPLDPPQGKQRCFRSGEKT